MKVTALQFVIQNHDFILHCALKLDRLSEQRYVTLLSTPTYLTKLWSLSLILNYRVKPLQGQRVHSEHSTAFNRSPPQNVALKNR